MEKFFEKMEAKFDKIITNFEEKPISTTIKAVITIYVIKTVCGWFKEDKKG